MIHIDLNAMAETLADIEQHLETLGEHISDEQRYKANFVCEEILTNLLRHADFDSREPDVNLALTVSETQALLLTFEDNSDPFNLLDFPDPEMDTALEEMSLGGLGIFLTKQYANELHYRYEHGYNILEVLL